MFTIDGTRWPWPCAITRTAQIRASDISGQLLDKTYFNDVLGTYMEYSVQIAVPLDRVDVYNALYETLTDPVEGHTFIFPYNSSSVTITGRVENVGDSLVRMPNSGQYWKGINFTVLSNTPTKTKSLSETIQRGRLIVPESAVHNEGDTWIWVNGRWELSVSYRDADTTRY